MPIILLWICIGLLGLILYMFQTNSSRTKREGFTSGYPTDFRTLLNMVDGGYDNTQKSVSRANVPELDNSEKKKPAGKFRYSKVRENEKTSLADPTFFPTSNEELKGNFLEPIIKRNQTNFNNRPTTQNKPKANTTASSLDQGKAFKETTGNVLKSSKPAVQTNRVHGETKYEDVLESINNIGKSLNDTLDIMPPDIVTSKTVTPTKATPKPVAAKPVASKPVAAKPVAAKSVAPKPVASKPVAPKIAAPAVCPPCKCKSESIKPPVCPPPKCPPQKRCPNMQDYIRKDQIPCWGCNLE
jgi:hypothetical protein